MRILSYNIHGLKNKLLFQKFFDYIKGFDIFLLLETHIEKESFVQYEKYFNGFKLYWKAATRSSNLGRASGGCLYGIRKELSKLGIAHSFKKIQNTDVIDVKINNSTINIIPMYIRSSYWQNEFNEIKEFFRENETIVPIVIGDLNARIGELQQDIQDIHRSQLDMYDRRCSKDKEKNGKGDQFMELCNDYGLIVLNGITKGDKEGELTFVGGQGNSVIDFCAISQEILDHVKYLQVDKQIWSDHMPLILSLKGCQVKDTQNRGNKLPRLGWREADLSAYKERLDANLIQEKCSKNILSLNDLTNIIQISGSRTTKSNIVAPNTKWFNNRCNSARKKSFYWLHKYHKSQNMDDKAKYLNANRNYKNVCEESKNQYHQELENKINKINNSKEWWKLVKEIKNQPQVQVNNIPPAAFQQYFQELLNPQQITNDISYASNFVTIEELDKPITPNEILGMLSKTKANKAPGTDGIPYEFFKNATYSFLRELADVYSQMYDSGRVDNSFETSIILPIFKKGDKNMPENYRGISFMNAIAKIMMGILNERLYKWVEQNNILTEYQAGFRQNYSTVDNVFNLASIVHLKFEKKKKVYAFFVDFKAAFDKVPRKLLFFKLRNMGVSTKMVDFIENVYANTKSMVWSGESFSEQFSTYSGVKQGCLMSPLLFSLYLNDLHDSLEGGLFIDDINIRLLLYADDIVILADDIAVLQQMIDRLQQYCEMWSMEVNLRKSAIMVFRRGGVLSKNEKWIFKGNPIDIVSEYCYLGVLLTPRLSFKKHLNVRNQSAKISIMSTWNAFFCKNNISLSMKWKMFQAVCRAIQSYAAQIWGYSLFEDVDKLQLFFVKKIFKLPDFTPTYVIMLESGIENGHLYSLDLHLRYIHSTLFEYKQERLPNKLALKVLQNQVFWAKSLNSLGANYNLGFNALNLNKDEWSSKFSNLLVSLSNHNREKMWRRSLESASNRIYQTLDHNVGKNYFNEAYDRHKIMWILKARCGLISLNGYYTNPLPCTLCNMNQVETFQHFLGVCPILKEYRIRFFGKAILNNQELINVLNGIGDRNWDNLVSYIKNALSYRKKIINEFL